MKTRQLLCVVLTFFLFVTFTVFSSSAAIEKTSLRISSAFSSNFSTNFPPSSLGQYWIYGPRVSNVATSNQGNSAPKITIRDGKAFFENNSVFTTMQGSYSYSRLSSQFRSFSPCSQRGSTVELLLCADKLPVNNLNHSKCGQTGLVLNIRMAQWNEEFYFCFFAQSNAEQEDEINVCIASYSCDRDEINQSLPELCGTLILNRKEFYKFTFVYDREKSNDKITVYAEGYEIGSFSKPTARRNDNPPEDFVCISLVNRGISSERGSSLYYAESASAIDYLNIYSEPIVPTPGSCNTPLFGQHFANTCGPASARMILSTFGVEKTEEEIRNMAANYGNFTGVSMLTSTINHFLRNAGIADFSFDYSDTENKETNIDSKAKFLAKIQENLYNNRPMQILLTTDDYVNYFGDDINHYVVIKGIIEEGLSEPLIEIHDPWDVNEIANDHGGQLLRIPLSVLYHCFNVHSSSLIYSI